MMAIHGGIDNIAENLRPYAGVAGTAHEIVRAYAGVNGVARLVYSKAILPPAYQQVEYIEGTGTQYINTGVYLSVNSLAMECDIQLTTNSYAGSTSAYLFGGYGGSSARFFVLCYASGGSNPKRLSLACGSGYRVESSNADTNRHVFKIDMANTKVYKDGTSVSTTSGSWSKGTNASTWLGVLNGGSSSGAANACVQAKCYGAKMWQNDELIHDYYPCYRKSDDEPGLYDIVTDTFLTNAGTGTFGVGPKYEQQL